MKEYYTTYSQAVKLKELGFDWKVLAVWHFDGEERNFIPDYGATFWHPQDIPHWNASRMWGEHIYSAPRLDQAQAWLREVKGWDVTSIPTLAEYGKKKYQWAICHWDKPEYGNSSNGIFDTYELALSAGIDAALELLTNKHTNK